MPTVHVHPTGSPEAAVHGGRGPLLGSRRSVDLVWRVAGSAVGIVAVAVLHAFAWEGVHTVGDVLRYVLVVLGFMVMLLVAGLVGLLSLRPRADLRELQKSLVTEQLARLDAIVTRLPESEQGS